MGALPKVMMSLVKMIILDGWRVACPTHVRWVTRNRELSAARQCLGVLNMVSHVECPKAALGVFFKLLERHGERLRTLS